MWLYGISAVTKVIDSSQTRSVSGLPGGANQLLAAFVQKFDQSEATPNSLEKIIDNKIKEIEKRIMNKLDERINRLEQKMEEDNKKILTLLYDIKANK